MATINGGELGIYINNKLIATAGKALEYPYPIVTEKVSSDANQEMTFQGLYVPDESTNEVELEYTTRRKGTVYFKCLNHPYIKSFSATDQDTYEQFKGIKRGTRISALITTTYRK